MRRPIAVDSPPGITSPSSPSSCSGNLTSTTCAPRRRSVAACSRKLPWTARTPMRGEALTPPILVTFGAGSGRLASDIDGLLEAGDDREQPLEPGKRDEAPHRPA